MAGARVRRTQAPVDAGGGRALRGAGGCGSGCGQRRVWGCPPGVQAVQDAVSGQLAKFKHPKRYVLVSGLPRNTMGKVQKNVLRDTYATEFQL